MRDDIRSRVSSKGCVLVVDGEPLITELVARRLSEAGFTTRVARSAADAEVHLRSREGSEDARVDVDVALIADRLPDGPGLDLVQRLRADPRTSAISIAILGVMRDPDQTLRALEAGADECLRKPIHRVELIARVGALCRMKRQLDELRGANQRLAELNDALAHSASTDRLTGLANRARLDERLDLEVARASRYGQPLSVLMMDVDFFKRVNDVYGHASGDAVLRALGSLLNSLVRRTDLAVRYGGEELVIVACDTALGAAIAFAERLRVAVEELAIPLPDDASHVAAMLQVTASFGVAEYRPNDDPSLLLARADAALYRAKRSGRNRVEGSDVPALDAAS